METATIFNIQKFCIHDGPGIRTTIFFKGCPLVCQWCHNPESQRYQKEMLVQPERCTLCGRCQKACSRQAIYIEENCLLYCSDRCNACEACINCCVNDARQLAGQSYTIEQLLVEIEKDRPFYEESGGGVTLSGGEAISQIDFVEKLAMACKARGLSVVLDTCGYAPRENFQRILPYIDGFFYDLKLMDASLHKKYTGADNFVILQNLQFLSNNRANLYLRLPLIGGVNTNDAHINAVLAFMKKISVKAIYLLPYHTIGQDKYRKLNKAVPQNFFEPSEEWLLKIADLFRQANYQVQIGG
jgi:pyruvate formate lyase activating enzyme